MKKALTLSVASRELVIISSYLKAFATATCGNEGEFYGDAPSFYTALDDLASRLDSVQRIIDNLSSER